MLEARDVVAALAVGGAREDHRLAPVARANATDITGPVYFLVRRGSSFDWIVTLAIAALFADVPGKVPAYEQKTFRLHQLQAVVRALGKRAPIRVFECSEPDSCGKKTLAWVQKNHACVESNGARTSRTRQQVEVATIQAFQELSRPVKRALWASFITTNKARIMVANFAGLFDGYRVAMSASTLSNVNVVCVCIHVQ